MNKKIRKILFYFFHPFKLCQRHKLKLLEKNGVTLSDEAFIKQMFKVRVGYDIDLENPKSINEKINWLKLHDRNPEHTKKVDKYLVRDYIKSCIGGDYLIPILGVWSNPDEIDFNCLPNKFVLKCNHNSGNGGIYICKDKQALTNGEILHIRNKLKKALEEDYYLFFREWPYKNVERKIIAEEYIEDSNGDLPDFKFWIFNGKFKLLFICRDRQHDLRMNFYDSHFSFLHFTRQYPNFKERDFLLPSNIKEMVSIAEKIALDDVFVRVDLYNVDGKIYFGEMTYFPGSGFEPFSPKKYDYIIGDMLDLPQIEGQLERGKTYEK